MHSCVKNVRGAQGFMNLTHMMVVFLGGGLGAVARYAASLGLQAQMPSFLPFPTLIINVLGSFLIGIIIAVLQENAPIWRLFLATGVMGGFTTFSAFSLETISLIQKGALLASVGYVVCSVLACCMACFLGLKAAGA